MADLLLATNNPGKTREFRRMLGGTRFTVKTPAEAGIALDVHEVGDSYEANALLKARAYAQAGHCLALADDSGIEVDALDGRPGIYSARYGGLELDDEGRVEFLLHELRDVPPRRRTARYRAVVALAWPEGTVWHSRTFEGVQEGAIAAAPRGTGGFGYDPVFLVDGRTQAELSAAEKDAISHRGKAVRAALEFLSGCNG